MSLNLWAIEDIWSVLVEDDGLPVQVARAGHRQEGQEEDHDGGEELHQNAGAPAVQDQDWCTGAQDWLVRLAAWLAYWCHKGWLGAGRLRLGWSVRGRIPSYPPTCLYSTLYQCLTQATYLKISLVL